MNDCFDLFVRQIVQIALSAAVVALATRIFFRRRPHWAYLLWMLVLVKALTPPVWSSWTGIFSWGAWHGGDGGVAPSLTIADIAPAGAHRLAIAAAPVVSQWNWPAMALAVWALGCAVVMAVAGARALAMSRRLKFCARPVSPELQRVFESLNRSLGIRRRVTLKICGEPMGPGVMGILRPSVVVPAIMLDDQNSAESRAILTHELIHVRRGDLFAAGLQLVAQAVWWFHPAMWWANRRINQLRESCCDAESIAGIGCGREDYAQVLLDVLRRRRELSPLVALPGVRALQVTRRRLDQVLHGPLWPHRRLPWTYWVALAIGGLLLLPGSGIEFHRGAMAAVTGPSTQPAQADRKNRHVRLVVGIHTITLQENLITLRDLPRELEKLPNRGQTILDIGYDSDQVPMGWFERVQDAILNDQERQKLGFREINFMGLTSARAAPSR